MSSPFIGEIRMFAGTFAPAGWALCQGQLQPISQNDTLFNLIGTTYGGDGQETFALPNLASRLPMHAGQGPGISQTYQLGESGGVENVTLATNQIPIHNHAFIVSKDPAIAADPTGTIVAEPLTLNLFFGDQATTALNAGAVGPSGGSQPHGNIQPYLVLNFIISLFGIFPTQN
jgi:microcystin-dependent protein